MMRAMQSAVLLCGLMLAATASAQTPPLLSPFAVLGNSGEVFLQNAKSRVVSRDRKTGRVRWTSPRWGIPVGIVEKQLLVLDQTAGEERARLLFVQPKSGKTIRKSSDFYLPDAKSLEDSNLLAWVDGKELVLTVEMTNQTGGWAGSAPEAPLTRDEHRFDFASGRFLRAVSTPAEVSLWEAPDIDHPAYKKLESRPLEKGEELLLRVNDGEPKRVTHDGESVAYEVTRDLQYVAVYRDEEGKPSTELYSLESGERVGVLPLIPRRYLAVFEGRAWSVTEDSSLEGWITPVLAVHTLPKGKTAWSNKSPRKAPPPRLP